MTSHSSTGNHLTKGVVSVNEGVGMALKETAAVAEQVKDEVTTLKETDTTPSAQSNIKQTVIRLKRRIEDSPSKILVVSYKKAKTDCASDLPETSSLATAGSSLGTDNSGSSEDLPCSKILRFVGTVTEDKADNNNIALAIRNIVGCSESSSSEIPDGLNHNNRKFVKAKTSKISQKARERFRKDKEESRFKIVSSKRGLLDGQELEECEKDLLKLLDLVPASELKEIRNRVRPEGFEPGNITCNGKPMVKEVSADEKGFVYDLYVSNDPCIEEFICDQFLSVEEGDELDFGEYRENDEYEGRLAADDDDSNDEDNWRNDYPDSEEEGLRDESYEGIGENSDDDLYNDFGGMRMKDDSSSDDDVVYGIEDDDGDYVGFDRKYARYKRRIMENEYADEVVSISSDSDAD